MALGVGISSIRNDKHAGNDSFGLVSLCSIGPILAVLILGMVYSTEGNFTTTAISEVSDSVELGKLFLYEIPKYLKEIALSLLPIVVFFGVFQIFAPKMNKKSLIKICVGLVYTYIGLVLFLQVLMLDLFQQVIILVQCLLHYHLDGLSYLLA